MQIKLCVVQLSDEVRLKGAITSVPDDLRLYVEHARSFVASLCCIIKRAFSRLLRARLFACLIGVCGAL